MQKFRIIAQQTPYSFTTPIVLIREAKDRTEAYINAYFELSGKGYNVQGRLYTGDAEALNIDTERVKKSLPEDFNTSSMVIFRSIQEFNNQQ